METRFEILNNVKKVIQVFDDRNDAWNYLDDNKGKNYKWRVKKELCP